MHSPGGCQMQMQIQIFGMYLMKFQLQQEQSFLDSQQGWKDGELADGWVSTQVNLLKTSLLLWTTNQAVSQSFRMLFWRLLFTQGGVLVLFHVLAFCIDCLNDDSSTPEKVRESQAKPRDGHPGRDSYREVKKCGKASRLSAKSYANIMFAFSTLYLTCLTSLFVFLSPRCRCSLRLLLLLKQ